MTILLVIVAVTTWINTAFTIIMALNVRNIAAVLAWPGNWHGTDVRRHAYPAPSLDELNDPITVAARFQDVP